MYGDHIRPDISQAQIINMVTVNMLLTLYLKKIQQSAKTVCSNNLFAHPKNSAVPSGAADFVYGYVFVKAASRVTCLKITWQQPRGNYIHENRCCLWRIREFLSVNSLNKERKFKY